MAKNRKLSLFRGDRSLWIIIAALCVVSMLVVYSATASMAYREVAGDTSHYLFRQARFIILGFFIVIVVHWIDYKSYARYGKFLFKVSVVLVILAYVLGVSLNDAPRWIRVPVIGLTFQPSDMLKITLVMVLAQQLGARQAIINRIPILPALTYGGWQRNPRKNLDIFIKTTKPLIVPIFVAAGVVMPANLSTAMIMFMVSIVILVTGRVRKREIVRLCLGATVALVLVVGVMKVLNVGRANVWVSRVTTYVEPLIDGFNGGDSSSGDGVVLGGGDRDDFQIHQARIAIASGGFFGKGPGNSTQRSQLPHPYSDFAYAFIIEEYGIFGGLVVLALYLWIFYRAGVIVRRCNRPSAGLTVLGLALSITTQAFVNMAVSVGLLPVTGQTLPLISLGGSSVFFTCIAFGMILGVSRQSDEYEAQLAEAERQRLHAERLAELEAMGVDVSEISSTDMLDDMGQDIDFEELYIEDNSDMLCEDEDEYQCDDTLDTLRNDSSADFGRKIAVPADSLSEVDDDNNSEFEVVERHGSNSRKNGDNRADKARKVVDLYDKEY